MHVQPPVVFNEAHFAELVHEEIDSGTGGANHLRQRFLADLRNHRLRFAFSAEETGAGAVRATLCAKESSNGGQLTTGWADLFGSPDLTGQYLAAGGASSWRGAEFDILFQERFLKGARLRSLGKILERSLYPGQSP